MLSDCYIFSFFLCLQSPSLPFRVLYLRFNLFSEFKVFLAGKSYTVR